MLQIAAAGGDMSCLLAGVRELPLSRLVLLYPSDEMDCLDPAKRVLEPLDVEVDYRPIDSEPITSVLDLITQVRAEAAAKAFCDIHVNVSSGASSFGAAGTMAAFIHGLRAFCVVDGAPLFLPIPRCGYHEVLRPPKMAILQAVQDYDGAITSLTDLGTLTGMDKPLLSYHLRGSKDSKGLEDMGLVTVHRGGRGRLRVDLTALGRMVVAAHDLEVKRSVVSRSDLSMQQPPSWGSSKG